VSEDVTGAAAEQRRELGRRLLAAAADQAVADAEEVVCVAWTRHLNRLLDTTRFDVALARRRCGEARNRVRHEQVRGDLSALAAAQAALELAEEHSRATSVDAVQVLDAVTDELALVTRAARRRAETVSASVRTIEDYRVRYGTILPAEPDRGRSGGPGAKGLPGRGPKCDKG